MPINVDAALVVATGDESTGACIWNDRGHFMARSYHPITALDTTTAEAQVVLHGIHLASQLGCQKLSM